MEHVERLIKKHLTEHLALDKDVRSGDCPDEVTLLRYLEGTLENREVRELEHHLAGCGFCLSQLNIAFCARQKIKKGSHDVVPKDLIDKAKKHLNITHNNTHHDSHRRKLLRRRLFLAATIVSFLLSFTVPKYFMQFLTATIVLGIRWAFESEGGRTLIMVLDSWRRHSQEKDDEISRHFKNRL